MPRAIGWEPRRGFHETTDVGEVSLQQVYAPRDEYPIADIVFVHGFQRPDEGYWLTATWTHANGVCWPTQILPLQAPEARILMFGYKNNHALDIFHNTRYSNAVTLVDMLQRSRVTAEAQTRPIVFVAHCVGGLIVKQAVLIAQTQGRLGQCIRGLMFFAVPNGDNDRARYAEVMANIIGATGYKVDGALMRAIEHDIPRVNRANDNFERQVARLRLISYQESRQTDVLRYTRQGTWAYKKHSVVDRESATVGLRGEMKITLGSRDHSSICKFSSIDDPGYPSPRDRLVGMIND